MRFFIILILIFSVVGFIGCRPRNQTDGENITEVERSVDVETIDEETAENLLPAIEATPVTDFEWVEYAGTIAIARYNGTGGAVVIPSEINGVAVTTIGDWAFDRKQLTSITIPDSVTTIGQRAFSMNQLENVTIGNSVTTIESRAFFDNQLTRVTIPNSVTTIQVGAFMGNPLNNITIASGNTAYITRDSFLLSYDQSQLILFFGNERNVTIPDSVSRIGTWAFAEKQLESAIIPNSVTFIDSWAFEDNQLTSITIPNSVTGFGGQVFDGNPLTSVTIGANVKLVIGVWSAPFGNGFEEAYNNGGRQAGTYTRENTTSTVWTRQ